MLSSLPLLFQSISWRSPALHYFKVNWYILKLSSLPFLQEWWNKVSDCFHAGKTKYRTKQWRWLGDFDFGFVVKWPRPRTLISGRRVEYLTFWISCRFVSKSIWDRLCCRFQRDAIYALSRQHGHWRPSKYPEKKTLIKQKFQPKRSQFFNQLVITNLFPFSIHFSELESLNKFRWLQWHKTT